MIAKISLGNSFGATVNYVLDKNKSAELIDSEGVRTKDKQAIIDSFLMQQEMKPEIKKPVYHISLGFSAQDSDKLTNEMMSAVAREYIQKMGISNTQYIMVRHYDKEHPHIHLCINRIDNNGKLISNKNDHFRNEPVCKELTKKYGLYFARGKEQVKRYRLRGADKIKYEIYDALTETIPKARNWQELSGLLATQGIRLEFAHKGKTMEIQGVIFSKDDHSFNGSKIDREFSYSKISRQLQANHQSVHIRESPRYSKERTLNEPLGKQREAAIPSFNNIYSEEENTSNNRKRKHRL